MKDSIRDSAASGKHGLLHLLLYLSEIFLVNVLFYIAFVEDLSLRPASNVKEISALYGWMSMTVTFCYVFGVWMKPVSFFYRTSRRGSIIQNVIVATVWQAALFLLFLFVVDRLRYFHSTDQKAIYALSNLLFFFTVEGCVLIAWRYICRTIIRVLRTNGHNVHRVIFVGVGDNIRELFGEMRNPYFGYRVEGYFAEVPDESFPEDLTYLGTVGDVAAYVQDHKISQLYCSLPSAMALEIRPLIDLCEHNCIRFFSVPNVRNYLKRQMQLELMGSVPVLCIREDALQSLTNRGVKRCFDIIVSGLFLIPFWLIIFPIIGTLTKILQPGPVFFRQKRNGINGEEFYCIKFRSMKVNADADKVQATKDDPRKTPFGNFLRKSSIDELPQFINVFKGDMSIVGPRPHMVKHTEEYSALIDKYMVRHWVRPGITGWAQVTGSRGETHELWQMEDRIKKDIWYIENWSLMLDIKIMILTVWNAVVGDKQAY